MLKNKTARYLVRADNEQLNVWTLDKSMASMATCHLQFNTLQ